MALRLRKPHARTDGPPVFSHEFVIQNHADIISCVCVVVFLGLIPQATSDIASNFIFLQYNHTVDLKEDSDHVTSRVDNKPKAETQYQHGLGDIYNVMFYSLIWIIVHALLNEYIWERTVKRLHLSKNKTSKYLDSGYMSVFYCVSVVMGINHIVLEGYFFNWKLLWEGYPHMLMRLSLKFYMLLQMGAWVHCYPELYLQKVKKDDIYSKLVLYTTSLLIIVISYVTYVQRLALLLLVTHYSCEFVFHVSRLLHYHGKDDIAVVGFKLWWFLFFIARIFTLIISIGTLWFGIQPNEPVLVGGVDITLPWVRIAGLVFIFLLQLWLLLTFMKYQHGRWSATPTEVTASTSTTKANKGKGKKKD